MLPMEVEQIPKQLKRIPHRPSLVIINHAGENTFPRTKSRLLWARLSGELKRRIGVAPTYIAHAPRSPIRALIGHIHGALDRSIGFDVSGRRVGPGLGAPVVISGSFTEEDLSRIRGAVEPYRISPELLRVSDKPAPSVVAKKIVDMNTVARLRESDLSLLETRVAGQATPSRAAFELGRFFHDRYVEGRAVDLTRPWSPLEPVSHREQKNGTSALAMISRPDLFNPTTRPDDLNTDVLRYVSLMESPVRGKSSRIDEERKARDIDPMRLDADQFRVVRLFTGKEGNADEKGRPTHAFTTNFPSVTRRSTAVDTALGYTPLTEGLILFGAITPELRSAYEDDIQVPPVHFLGAHHFYKREPLPYAAQVEMRSVAERKGLGKAILDLWRDDELRFDRKAGLAAQMISLESHDQYTSGHSQRVSMLAEHIARKLSSAHFRKTGKPLFSRARLQSMRDAGLLHDIGKLATPSELLNKKDLLSYDEFQKIKEHPAQVLQILGPLRVSQVVMDGALYHHERHDGHGYPHGLKGVSIPLVARIIAVADVIDAFLTERQYPRRVEVRDGVPYGKSQFSWEYVRRQILEFTRKGQFDPSVARMAALLKDSEIRDIYRKYAAPTSGKGVLLRISEEDELKLAN